MDDLLITNEEVKLKPVEIKPELLRHPNIPKPLHGMNPRTIMKTKWWNEKRREAYARNNYHCTTCGAYHEFDVDRKVFVDIPLHAHEYYRIDYDNCSAELVYIFALCPICHDYIHSGRMNAMYEKGVLDEADCWLIRSQGERVLGEVIDNVDKRDYTEDWNKWHLIIDGKKYFSKFKSIEEWREFYATTKK